MHNPLRSALLAWATFTDEEYLLLEKYFTKITLTKNEHWLKAGQYCSHVVFIEAGLMRYYYLADSGDEVTCYFARENEFVTSYHSYTQNIVSYENIEALSDCSLWVIHRNDFNYLSAALPQIKVVWELSVQKLILQMEDRIAMLQSLSAEKRYRYLLTHHREFLLYIPLQYIASYLGITPQHLSRLRKSIS